MSKPLLSDAVIEAVRDGIQDCLFCASHSSFAHGFRDAESQLNRALLDARRQRAAAVDEALARGILDEVMRFKQARQSMRYGNEAASDTYYNALRQLVAYQETLRQTSIGIADATREYRWPDRFARDKWIYEKFHTLKFNDLSVELEILCEKRGWGLIKTRNAIKNAAKRYAEFYSLPWPSS